MTVEAVIFDWGGTLAAHPDVELMDMWRAAAAVLAPDAPGPLTETLVSVERRSWAKTQTTMRSARLMDLLREASDEVGLDVAEAVLSNARDAHLDAWTPSISHHDAARSVLADVRARGLAVGLLSNTHWPRSFHEKFLARDDLAELIDRRVYTSEIDWIKPHPIPFEMIAEDLDVDAARCVFVGDRPVDDIEGAAAAGMTSVWIRTADVPGDGEVADHVIDDLADLPSVLDALT